MLDHFTSSRGENSIQLDLGSFADGMYLIMLESPGDNRNLRVIVDHLVE